jgi:hypothetical protein
MRLPTILIPTALALASLMPAQTQTLRGSVEDVRNTQNQFYLECTNIPVVSSTMNLNLLVNQDSILEVVNIGTPGAPVLDVRAATPTAKVFGMGNLRLNRSDRWQVNAAPGSFTIVYFGETAGTGWMPFGAAGVWLLGNNHIALTSGFTSNFGQFEFSLFVPNVPHLLGTSYTGQALVFSPTSAFISNPDCKVVEAN